VICVTDEFSEPFCRIRPYVAGGWLSTSLNPYIGTVAVTDAHVVLSDSTGRVIDRASVSSTELDTPGYSRTVSGAVAFVRMNGNRWAIDFSLCAFTARRRGWGRARRVIYGILPLGRGLGQRRLRGKQLNAAFTEALVAGGATQLRADPPSPR
jgi:hypothetical protein